ncbi:hypothetical protein XaplCFBP3123_17815 [Xanthomonas arboricola pv. populi]|nr:hypothetical protein XaplCFBP3123_17815 [Xanthomonas arboricola pv. populi]
MVCRWISSTSNAAPAMATSRTYSGAPLQRVLCHRDDDQSAEMDALKTVLTQFLSSCGHPVPVELDRGMPGA